MAITHYFNTLLAESSVPVIVSELNTNTIVYVNELFEKMLPIKQDLLGRSYLDIICPSKVPGSYQFTENWKALESYTQDVYVTESGRHLKIVSQRVDLVGVPYNLTKIITVEEMSNSGITFEEAMTQCLATLHLPDEEVIPSLLNILETFYDSDRAYFYRIDMGKSSMRLVSELDRRDPDDINKKTAINATALMKWTTANQTLGILNADRGLEDYEKGSPELSILNTFNLHNFTFSLMENAERELIGMVGVSNYESRVLDDRLLRAISRFITQNLNNESLAAAYSLADKDMLTGLYNRNMYNKRLEQLSSFPPKTLGILSIDVNGVKQINANLSDAEGDARIRGSAQFLLDHFKCDFYRISGDEFVGIAQDVEQDIFEEQVETLHNQVKEEGNGMFAVGHSFGRGTIPFQDLFREAETVMYINKQEYYHNSDRTFDTVKDSTLSDLLSFLDNDEFMIYLQPQVWLKDASIYGAEALIRRFDKTNQKMVFPDQFIPLYEKKSLIRHIDIFVVNTVCKLLEKWSLEGHALPISVNLSRVTLLEHGIVKTIADICDQHNVPHNLLVIEVTERVGLIENNVASSLVTDFKNLGFNISLDDFGCAYSNIVTLAQIEVDEVKIDKSLVDELTTNIKNHVLVKNVLSMCNELENTSTLAEGIESEEQADTLRNLGCHLAQGYFYSRPIPVEEFEEKYIYTDH